MKNQGFSPEFSVNTYHDSLVWFMSVVHDKYFTVLIALLDIQTITSLIFDVTESKSNILKKSHKNQTFSIKVCNCIQYCSKTLLSLVFYWASSIQVDCITCDITRNQMYPCFIFNFYDQLTIGHRKHIYLDLNTLPVVTQ